MIQKNQIEQQYRQFVSRIVQNQKVYTLATEQGVAVCPSNEYDTPQGKEAVVFMYWSEEEKARQCQKEEWEDYEILEIPLAEFLEAWCLGMAEDGTIAGVDFDAQLFGVEVLPVELLKEILTILKQYQQKIKFKEFASVEDLENYINEVENNS